MSEILTAILQQLLYLVTQLSWPKSPLILRTDCPLYAASKMKEAISSKLLFIGVWAYVARVHLPVRLDS